MKQRVQKILAHAGIASRRKCEELIAQGQVTVNGKVATLGEIADPKTDKIAVKGKPIVLERKVYIMLNKPKGAISTVQEKHGRTTVRDLVDCKERVFPVGRLDKDTTGLLLLTNDGNWANNIAHPRYNIEKEYRAELDRPFKQAKKRVVIDGRPVECKFKAEEKNVTITLHEGRKHIVKRVFEKLGFKVQMLHRARVGPLRLDRLKPGQWRYLTEAEVELFK